MTTTYVCERGHEREEHRSQPDGHDMKPVCLDCRADIVERRVAFRRCEDCGHQWPFTGTIDKPTCPNCHGKRTMEMGE